jgi:DNA transformation protein and related proteins
MFLGKLAKMARSIGNSNRPQGTVTEKIRNVGPKSAAWLKQVGIRSTEDVRAIGAFAAYAKVRRAGFKAGLNLLYALAGAEDDIHWQLLDPERKRILFEQQAEHELALKAQKKIFAPRETSRAMGASLVERALGKSEPDHD